MKEADKLRFEILEQNERIGIWLVVLGFVLLLIAVLLLITGLTTVYESYGRYGSTCYGYDYNTGTALVLTFIGSVITIIGLIRIIRCRSAKKKLLEEVVESS